jgi:hypothetical protein
MGMFPLFAIFEALVVERVDDALAGPQEELFQLV